MYNCSEKDNMKEPKIGYESLTIQAIHKFKRFLDITKILVSLVILASNILAYNKNASLNYVVAHKNVWTFYTIEQFLKL